MRALLLTVLLGLACGARAAVLPDFSPLDPLSPEEITATAKTLKNSGLFSAEAFFPVMVLQEPPKAEILSGQWQSPRRAFVVIQDRKRDETSEAVVDLADQSIESWRILPDVEPNLTLEELAYAGQTLRADPRWQDAMTKRGITDFSQVYIDVWAPGTVGVTDASGPRLARALSFFKGSSTNEYARPIEGVVALLDMNQRKVVEVTDTGAVPLSHDEGALDEDSIPSRAAPKPLERSQPDGPSFTLSGHEIRWQNWSLRWAITPREGLVLYTVGYEDQGKLRSILYRASLSEMAVAYGDPDPDWGWRGTLVEGAYGIGSRTAPLEPGVDAPKDATFFDADLADDAGRPRKIARAAALYERDGGLLWRHYAADTDRDESRRGRELVLKSMAAVGNNDYGFDWIFHQDGTLEAQVELSGIPLAKGVTASTQTAQRVSELIAAPIAQDFFNFRLDFDVDGASNSVIELDAKAAPAGRANPYGDAIELEAVPLKTSLQAQRDANPASARRWLVQNRSMLNSLGQPVGYALIPGETAVPLARPESKLRKRAGFIDHQFWATPYDAEEMYAAGDYPNQNQRTDGLSGSARRDDPLEDRDLVVWYTMGVTHLPRPEDWPIMPVARTGFKLMPAGFFTHNPALDVPRPPIEPAPNAAHGKQKKSKPKKK